jgi:hypothetical protein
MVLVGERILQGFRSGLLGGVVNSGFLIGLLDLVAGGELVGC